MTFVGVSSLTSTASLCSLFLPVVVSIDADDPVDDDDDDDDDVSGCHGVITG